MICPVDKELRPPPLVLHLSNILFYHDLQLRSIADNDSNDVLIKISPDSYKQYYKVYVALDITNLANIRYRSPQPRLARRAPTEDRLFTFHEFYQSLSKQKQKLKFLDHYRKDLTTPPFYQALICLFSTWQEANSVTNLTDHNHKFTIRKDSKDWNSMLPIEPLELNEEVPVDIYTDGSLKINTDSVQMGSAAIFYQPHLGSAPQEIAFRQFRPTSFQPSSTKPEIQAVLGALIHIPTMMKTTIYTDSQCTINNINAIAAPTLQDRQLLKMPNHTALTSIKYEISKREQKPIIIKIQAHAGHEGNERADEEAKNARSREETNIPYLDPLIKSLVQNTFLHLSGNLQEIYPRRLIKSMDAGLNNLLTNKSLDKHLMELFLVPPSCIDWSATKSIASCSIAQSNHLDARFFLQQKFRINLLTNKMPLNKMLFDQNLSDQPYCPHCPDIEEDQHHLWECPNSLMQSRAVQRLTYINLKNLFPNQFVLRLLGIRLSSKC
jgi:ribonuclease HI